MITALLVLWSLHGLVYAAYHLDRLIKEIDQMNRLEVLLLFLELGPFMFGGMLLMALVILAIRLVYWWRS